MLNGYHNSSSAFPGACHCSQPRARLDRTNKDMTEFTTAFPLWLCVFVVPNLQMKKTNFDRYLAEQLRDPGFAKRFKRAGEAWDVALQIAALREQAGLSQQQLAAALKTSQQQISRLESPGYVFHMLGSYP